MKRSKEYYLKPNKLIRDHAHEYVIFTDFELTIIDTIEFQRLKDVRQLTCQQVYPRARHTRFEHSLDVMELTRQAINSLYPSDNVRLGEINEMFKQPGLIATYSMLKETII